jgi:hypothetical protein
MRGCAEIGENDVASRLDELRTFLDQPSVPAISAVSSSRANAGGRSLL